MRWLDLLRLRLRSLFRRTDVDRDLDDELKAFVEERTDRAIAAGMTPADARAAAQAALGSPIRLKEDCRDARRLNLLDDLVRDLRHGARLLRRNPLFAISAALVLAIGIGATTTIFTVANGLLLRAPAGVAQPETLVDLFKTGHGDMRVNPTIVYGDYLEIRQRVTTLEGVYAYQIDLTPISMKGSGGAERIYSNLVTTNYFSVLGVQAAAGRLFTASDSEQPGASPIIVLSHAFWARRFHSDPAIVGQTLTLNGQPFTVVGVAREGFSGTGVVAADVWVPTAMSPVVQSGQQPMWLQLLVGGRLRAGVSMAQAAAEVDTIGRTLPQRKMFPPGLGATGVGVAGASPIPGGGLRLVLAGFLALLAGMVSIVLVITCANVAGILLARATVRRREIAVRLAMGAGRARVMRQLLAETLLLFVLGGAAGLFLARVMTSLLLAMLPTFALPVAMSLPLDGRVVAFTLGLSLLAALFSGLAPGRQASRTDVVSALKDDSQGPSDRLRLRSAFVVAQVAFSLLLVVVAGLLVRALDRVTVRGQAFDPRGIELASIDLSMAGYTAATGPLFAQALTDRVRQVPGVEAATMAERLPAGGIMNMSNEGLMVPGVPPPAGQPFFSANWYVVGPGFFSTLRIPLVAGRDFNDGDRDGTQPVVILPESTARRLWPGQDPVGQYVTHQVGRADVPMPVPTPIRTTRLLVIGVARDATRENRATDVPALALYVPLAQRYSPRVMMLARTTHGQRVANEIRALVASMDPNLPIIGSRTVEDEISGPIETQLRIASSVSGSVGLIGVLIAAVGIYGVTAYAVARRTREIGVRMAMGAQRADVVRMVLRQGMTLVVTGAAIGLVLAAIASRLLVRLLFGLPPLDPLTFGGATLLFMAIGLAACYIPARRATQIDAMDALRCE